MTSFGNTHKISVFLPLIPTFIQKQRKSILRLISLGTQHFFKTIVLNHAKMLYVIFCLNGVLNGKQIIFLAFLKNNMACTKYFIETIVLNQAKVPYANFFNKNMDFVDNFLNI